MRGHMLLRDRTFCWCVGVRAMLDGVDSGWVFLRIAQSMNLCSQFGRVMDIKTGSESFWCYGSDGGNLLLTVGIGRRQGQRKDAEEDHKC